MVVNVGIEVEDVHFDGAVGAIVQRRTAADVQHAAVGTAVYCDADCIDTAGGNEFVRGVDVEVGCGIAQLVAYLKTASHRAVQEVAVTQVIGCAGYLALVEQTADAGRTDTQVFACFSRNIQGGRQADFAGQDLNAQFAAIAHVVVETLATVVAEAVVVADEECADIVTVY